MGPMTLVLVALRLNFDVEVQVVRVQGAELLNNSEPGEELEVEVG